LFGFWKKFSKEQIEILKEQIEILKEQEKFYEDILKGVSRPKEQLDELALKVIKKRLRKIRS